MSQLKPARSTVRREPPQPRASLLERVGTWSAVAALLLGASFLITGTWTWGYSPPSVASIKRQLFPSEELVFTPEQLRSYDGRDRSKPIYLAVMGDVFDVTEGREYYGPKGGYEFFAGRDAGRAFVTGCFTTHLTPDLRGLSREQLKEIDTWRNFYKNHEKYFYVGKVIHPPIDPASPIPEPCDQNDNGNSPATGTGKPVANS